MIEWTCCECGESYIDKITGDVGERTCYECFDKDSELIEGEDIHEVQRYPS